jgi:hypothetical protein
MRAILVGNSENQMKYLLRTGLVLGIVPAVGCEAEYVGTPPAAPMARTVENSPSWQSPASTTTNGDPATARYWRPQWGGASTNLARGPVQQPDSAPQSTAPVQKVAGIDLLAAPTGTTSVAQVGKASASPAKVIQASALNRESRESMDGAPTATIVRVSAAEFSDTVPALPAYSASQPEMKKSHDVTARTAPPSSTCSLVSFPVEVPAPAGSEQPAPAPLPTSAVGASGHGYGHAADYGWLVGEVQYLRAQNVWHLRFAPADEDDRNGGCVLLAGEVTLSPSQSGQRVRVSGCLVNPDAADVRPLYWVKSLEVLEPLAIRQGALSE